MSIEQNILAKLEPHAKRIKDGESNDFDYLPAVLLHVIQEQKQVMVAIDEQSRMQIAKSTSDLEKTIGQIEVAFNQAQTEIQNSRSSLGQQMTEQITESVSAHANHVTQLNAKLDAIDLEIKSCADKFQKSHVKLTRFLLAVLAGMLVMIGLSIAIILRVY